MHPDKKQKLYFSHLRRSCTWSSLITFLVVNGVFMLKLGMQDMMLTLRITICSLCCKTTQTLSLADSNLQLKAVIKGFQI